MENGNSHWTNVNSSRKSRDSIFSLDNSRCYSRIPFCSSRFCPTNSDRPVKKCSFSIDSLLESKTSDPQISNRSYNEDTEDGSSDDGHISFRSPPLSSYALFNQLKTLDMTTTSSTTKSKADPTGKISEKKKSPKLIIFSSS